MYADEILRPWLDSALGLVPGVELFDAHTHTGSNDPDGFRSTAAQIVAGLELADARGVVFTTQETEGYRAANDRVIAEAEESGGRLVPFARLDPADEPLAEAERAFGRGAKGIKLHPRAEDFRLDDERLEPVYALAAERRLPVLTHAGRGIPALGEDALAICRRHPELPLILAHDGVSDLGWLWQHAAEHPNLYFDTSWWSTTDHLTLFGLVPPGQILFASDMPYGTTTLAAIMALRSALEVGLELEQIRHVMGAQLARLLDGERPADLGPAPGAQELRLDIVTQRIHDYCVAALSRMLIGDPAPDYVGLARLASEVGDASAHAEVGRSVIRLLDSIDDYVGSTGYQRPKAGVPGPRLPYPAVSIVVVAANVAMTPHVPVP
ncbi:MAG: amidohydrolase family protein [Actinomycetota bacterium]|nr:amidohydrolase family protein [Actinomycetota bacterium]